MSKRERKPPSKPSNAYLISFGDTMTAMLAFFIVLNTLSKEQTGANLHSGTGSFVAALNSMGLPGSFAGEKSKRTIQQLESAPKYIVTDGEESEEGHGKGPDEDSDNLRTLERELEQVQRMLNELEDQFDLDESSTEQNAISFDLFQPLGPEGNLLPRNARKVIGRSLASLLRPEYRMEIKLWSPMPATSAMKRISDQAFDLQSELKTEFPMLFRRKSVVRTTMNLWPFSEQRRPTMTIIVIKESVKY